jgi:hypothetical protein
MAGVWENPGALSFAQFQENHLGNETTLHEQAVMNGWKAYDLAKVKTVRQPAVSIL